MGGEIPQDPKQLISQRWDMLTNSHAGTVEPMTKLSELEVMEHSMMIDVVCAQFGLERLTDEELREASKRFIKFCQTQYKNRN